MSSKFPRQDPILNLLPKWRPELPLAPCEQSVRVLIKTKCFQLKVLFSPTQSRRIIFPSSSVSWRILPNRVILIEISRSLATSSQPSPPEERAAEIINKLPSSPNLITKTGTAILGTGLAAAAISQELYVVNEESIILIASAIFFTFLAKVFQLSVFWEPC